MNDLLDILNLSNKMEDNTMKEGRLFFDHSTRRAEDKMSSLKRFKDDAKEVGEGYECGITLEKFRDFKEGDIFEAFIMEEYRD